MTDIPIKVRCLGDMCKGCNKMDIVTEGVHMLWDGIRGLPIFDPHCKYIDVCQNALNLNKPKEEQKKGINLNDWIKVKLTAHGKDIHRRWKSQIAHLLKTSKVDIEPETDEDGYTKYQLWQFIELFGQYIGMGEDAVIMPLVIVPVDRAKNDEQKADE